MTRRKNKTDQPFRDQLKHFEATPPEHVWHGIASALASDTKKRRVMWVGRVAASIAVLLVIGTTWLLLREAPENKLVSREETKTGTLRETEISKTVIPDEKEVSPDTRTVVPDVQAALPENNREVFTRTTGTGSKVRERMINQTDAQDAEDVVMASGDLLSRDPLKAVPARSMPGLQTNFREPGTLLARRNYPSTLTKNTEGIDVFEEWDDEKIASHDKWGVGTQVSPIYSYRNLEASGGSVSSASYYNDVEEGVVSYAGGVNVQYAPFKRLSIQSGLHYSSMGIKVGNAYYANMQKSIFFDETTTIQASINNSTGIIETEAGLDYAIAANTVPQAGWELATEYARANVPDASTGEILQQFQYLELPFILRYRVIDRKLGFHFLGGLSSNFLVGNSAYYQDGENKEEIGTTGNLRPVNYSSVVGLGLDYAISKRFHINLEPTFRYYLNSINTGSLIKSHPYTIGFYTGLLYTF